jgi:hypothetical protein
MSHACAFQTTGRGHATRTRSTCFVRELRHPNLPQQKARRLAPSAPVPAVQRLGPHLDGPGTQGVPISHRVAQIPPEQWRLSGAQPAAPAPRAPRPGQLLGERVCCLLVLNLVSSTLSCIRQPRPRTPSGHHRHAGSPAYAPRMPGVSGRERAAPAARGAGAELRPVSRVASRIKRRLQLSWLFITWKGG